LALQAKEKEEEEEFRKKVHRDSNGQEYPVFHGDASPTFSTSPGRGDSRGDVSPRPFFEETRGDTTPQGEIYMQQREPFSLRMAKTLDKI
jgi:hypothetical protein